MAAAMAAAMVAASTAAAGWPGGEGGGNGGGGGNRTRVPRCSVLGLYARSPSFVVIRVAPTNRIAADQPDCVSSPTGRAAADDQPAVCRFGPPQAKGPRRRCLVLRQRGSSACWHLVGSSRIYEVPGPRRATAGRVGIRSKPIAPVSCGPYRACATPAQAAPGRSRAPGTRRPKRDGPADRDRSTGPTHRAAGPRAPALTAPGPCSGSRSTALRRGCSGRWAGCWRRRAPRPGRRG